MQQVRLATNWLVFAENKFNLLDNKSNMSQQRALAAQKAGNPLGSRGKAVASRLRKALFCSPGHFESPPGVLCLSSLGQERLQLTGVNPSVDTRMGGGTFVAEEEELVQSSEVTAKGRPHCCLQLLHKDT